MEFFRKIESAHIPILAGNFLLAGWLTALLFGCSSVPIKIQCSEIETRMGYDQLTEDQMRFAKDELDDCRNRQRQAEAKDSAFVEGTEKRFTPEADINADSTKAESEQPQ